MEYKRWKIDMKDGCDATEKAFDTPEQAIGTVILNHLQPYQVRLLELRQTTIENESCYQLVDGYGGLIASVYLKRDIVGVA